MKDEMNAKGSYGKLFLGFVLLILLLTLSGCKNQKPKMVKIGILCGVTPFAAAGDGFISKMSELGYKKGINVVYDFQNINSDMIEVKKAADKMVTDQVDLIVAFPTGAALAAKAAVKNTDIPVVFTYATIDSNDLVKGTRETGGNITGVRLPPISDYIVKRFEILMAIAPQIKRVLLFNNINYGTSVKALEILEVVAKPMGVKIVAVPITSIKDVIADFKARDKATDIGIDGIFLMPEPLTIAPGGFEILSRFAAKNKIPLSGSADYTAKKGALFSFTPNYFETGLLAAPLADKILKGTLANSLPLVTPEARLRLNLKQAGQLGLTVPESLLKQAIEIIR